MKTTLFLFLALTGLLAARSGSAQIGYASSSATVTILPADPALRPVPAQGMGVRWDLPLKSDAKLRRHDGSLFQSSCAALLRTAGSGPRYKVRVRTAAEEIFSTYLLQTTRREIARGTSPLPPIETTMLLLE